MSFARRSPLTILSACVLAAVACDENPESPPLGDLEITTSAPAPEPRVTADGWTVEWKRFLVHVTAVNVAGDDRTLAASASPQLFDLVSGEPQSLLASSVRTARAWEDVSLQIGPAAADTELTVVPPATDADRERMVEGGLSVHVEASLTKDGAAKSIAWSFTTDTIHARCEEPGDGGAVTRGLVVPAGGVARANVVLDPAVLLADVLGAPGELRGDAIASADVDADGDVTLDELGAVGLEAARSFGGAYAVPEGDTAADLRAFVEAQSRRIVVAFRARGTCTPEPAPPAD